VRADFRQRSAETLDLTIARQVAWKLAHRVLELPVRACSDQSATGLRVIAPCCLYSRSRMHACRHSTIGEMRVWGGGDEMNLWFSKIFDKRMNFEIGMGGGHSLRFISWMVLQRASAVVAPCGGECPHPWQQHRRWRLSIREIRWPRCGPRSRPNGGLKKKKKKKKKMTQQISLRGGRRVERATKKGVIGYPCSPNGQPH